MNNGDNNELFKEIIEQQLRKQDLLRGSSAVAAENSGVYPPPLSAALYILNECTEEDYMVYN